MQRTWYFVIMQNIYGTALDTRSKVIGQRVSIAAACGIKAVIEAWRHTELKTNLTYTHQIIRVYAGS
jgi:hypothetical protein